MSHTSESLRDAFKYLFPDEVTALKELANRLQDYPSVVNIGAGAGTSGLAFLESRPDLYLYTVDVQKESSPFGCLEAEEQVVKAAAVDWTFDGIHTRWTQYHMDSKELAATWSLNNVDMVFVDGDHSYLGCKGDILGWIPHLIPGGILAVHDYGKEEVYKNIELPHNLPHPRPWPGVDKAVNELLVGAYKVVLHVDSLIAFEIQP